MKLYNFIQTKIKRTKDERIKKRKFDGFNLAAGELLRGKSVENVQSYTECSMHFGDYDNFDAGYDEAIYAWEKMDDECVRCKYSGGIKVNCILPSLTPCPVEIEKEKLCKVCGKPPIHIDGECVYCCH